MTAPSDGAGTAAPPSARSLLSRRTHIQPGDTILLELPTKLVKVVKLSLDSRNIVQLGKYGTFDADAELVGKPYGVTYEIVPAPGSTSRGGESSGETAEGAAGTGAEAGDTAEVVGADAADGAADGKMSGASKRKQKREAAKEKTRSAKGKGKGVAVTNSTSKQLDSLRPLEGLSLDDIEVTEATNEKILAQGAKTLDPAKILELKAQGVSGAEIIAMQIAAHEQFELKNEYSKAKYTKRKEAKFLKFITPLPPTVHNLCQYYFNDDPRRIRELRPDTLAQMLALANVRQGSRVLVVDDASGLVTAAVAERVAGEGLILVLHPHDSPPPNQSLPMLNLPESYITPPVLRSIHWGHTNEDWQSSTLPVEPDGEDAESERQKSRLNRRKRTQDTLQESVQEFRDGDFDACIISSIYEPVSILKRILPALGGSAQIVVQSPVLQVLADLSKTLIFDRSYLNPTILEPFLRQYQVLPGRTHPTMNGTAHGGYILHAIRIYDTEGASSARATGLVQDRPNKKKRR